jgi:hypothetical protein
MSYSKCHLTRRALQGLAPLALWACGAPITLAGPVVWTFAPGDGEALAIRSSRDYERLRKHAKTPEEFNALARWSQGRVEKYQSDQAGLESDLRDFYARQAPIDIPKFPPRDRALKALIDRDKELIAHWSQLASQYAAQAQKLESSKTER